MSVVGAAEPSGVSGAPSRDEALDERVGGLDGARGLAVLGVLAYHGGFTWASGGFLGVSMFFTISGFLITSILLRRNDRRLEEAGDARVLRGFWGRRYRRLVPASMVTIAGVLVFGATVATRSQLESLPAQVAASFAQVVNWYFVATEQSYAALFASPSPLQHFWSLAIEEQFYLLFPLALVALLRRVRSRAVQVVALAAAALASSVWMAVLSSGGASFERVYYGTDTRAAELLVGAVLGVLAHRGTLTTFRWPRVLAGGGAIALVAVVAAMSAFSLRDDLLWRGGILVFALLSATVVASLVPQRGVATTVLSVAPLVALGRISYGVYLFHWPIFLWLDEERTGLSMWPLFVLRLAVVLPLAALSYRVIEQPIRNGSSLGLSRSAFRALAPVSGVVLLVGAVAVSSRSGADDPLLVAEEESAQPAPGTDTSASVIDVVVVADEASGDLVERVEATVADDATVRVRATVPFACPELDPTSDRPVCSAWATEWPTLVTVHDPDVVLFAVQRWDPASLAALSGMTPGEPRVVGWTEDLLSAGFDLLTEAGARVVWGRIPGDVLTEARLETEPFDLAMNRLVVGRSDVRRALGRSIEAPAEGETPVDVQARAVVEDLGVYARRASGATRVLVVGDSAAWTMAAGLEAWSVATGRAVVWNAATKGCGMLFGGALRELALAETRERPLCASVRDGWVSAIDEFDPDLVIVLSTIIDLQERRLDEWPEFQAPGDDDFDRYLVDGYVDAFDALASGGATVVWMTAPCTGGPPMGLDPDPFSARRASHLNEVLLPRVEESRPALETYDLFGALCPDGEFERSLGGVDDVRPDGVHFSDEGARWFADAHGDTLVGLGAG